MDLLFLAQTFESLLEGVPLTLLLAGSSLVVSTVLALGLALMRGSEIAPLDWLARAFVFVFRGSPLLVQIFLIYYGLSQFPELRASVLWPYLREPFWCTLLALALNGAAYGSEVVRGGLQAVPRGEIEAARACGMSGLTLFRRVVFPSALRQALPAYGNEIVLTIKATSLASVVTLMEVTGIAQGLIAQSFRALEVFVCAGSIYLAINFAVTRAVRILERSLSHHRRPAPAPQTAGACAA